MAFFDFLGVEFGRGRIAERVEGCQAADAQAAIEKKALAQAALLARYQQCAGRVALEPRGQRLGNKWQQINAGQRRALGLNAFEVGTQQIARVQRQEKINVVAPFSPRGVGLAPL